MAVIKCPRCDINFIREDDKFCSICKREMKGEMPKEELPDMCIECGEHVTMRGEDICIFCYNERKLSGSKIKKENEVEDLDIDRDIPIAADDEDEDIPDNELEVIHQELGLDDVIQMEEENNDDDEPDEDLCGF